MGNVFESDDRVGVQGRPGHDHAPMCRSDSFPGRVDYVGALVDPASKATAVRIVVPNPKRALKQNMLVHVDHSRFASRGRAS